MTIKLLNFDHLKFQHFLKSYLTIKNEIIELNLSNNDLSLPLMNIVKDFINENQILKNLSLANCSLYDKHFKNISRVLNENKTLKFLNLENNMFTNKITTFIPDLIKKININLNNNYEDKIKWYRDPNENFKCINSYHLENSNHLQQKSSCLTVVSLASIF